MWTQPTTQKRRCHPSKNGTRLQVASLTQKWRQTAIFTLHFKKPTATTSELSAPKFLLDQNGVRFDKLCSAGRRRIFHSRSRPRTRLKSANRTSSLLRAKRFMILPTRQQIIQTGERRRKITLSGKFIP